MFSEDGRFGLMTDRAGTMIGVATMRQGQARRATPKCFDCFEWRCRLSITRRRLDVDDHFRSIVLRSIRMPRSVQNRPISIRETVKRGSPNLMQLSPFVVSYIYIYIRNVQESAVISIYVEFKEIFQRGTRWFALDSLRIDPSHLLLRDPVKISSAKDLGRI